MRCQRHLLSVLFATLLAGAVPVDAAGAPAKKAAPPKKAAPATKAAPAKKAAPAAKSAAHGVASIVGSRGLGRWTPNQRMRAAALTITLPKVDWKRELTRQNASLAEARRVLAMAPTAVPLDTLARALYLVSQEAPGEVKGATLRIGARQVDRNGVKVSTGAELADQLAYYHELYDVPCRGRITRSGTSWPPQYRCSDPAAHPSAEPTAAIHLQKEPRVIAPPTEVDPKEKAPPKGILALEKERKSLLAERDIFPVPGEALRVMPSQFCVRGKGAAESCHGAYKDVAIAVYGAGRGSDNLPVFCAPARAPGGKDWETTKVHCSGQWLETLGTWQPWGKNGEPSPAPADGVLPPFACFGSPHLLKEHMKLPFGGAAGNSGFQCRNRIFRILAKKGEKNLADADANMVRMCEEMRGQVWGEKYPKIDQMYATWCNSPQGPREKSKCPKVRKGAHGEPLSAPPPPFMLLSREELLFFYGHRELFCRADRPGLAHFLAPEHKDQWAKSFTCDVPRGLLEAGPFEEGVQACALSPFLGDTPGAGANADLLKARLHCWKFSRPLCEQLSDKVWLENRDSIHRSEVFDVYDALRAARRTQQKDVWGYLDLKDAEKVQDFQERLAFSDIGKDEGTFGVKDFCRFVGNRRELQCGYTKKTVADWYELHRAEEPEGCSSGVCYRGAFRRGYYCGLFSAPDYFQGKPTWICGVDTGLAGKELLEKARAVCVGGARAKQFQSAKGDKGSLQCYERRFRWGETEKSEDILRRFGWPHLILESAKHAPEPEPWLIGGAQAHNLTRNIKSELLFWLPGGAGGRANLKNCRELRNQERYSTDKCGYIPEYDRIVNELTPKVLKRAPAGNWWAGLSNTQISDASVKAIHDSLALAKRDVDQALAARIKEDVSALVGWAMDIGHTLGHRASARQLLLASNQKLVMAFKALKFKQTQHLDYGPYVPGGKHEKEYPVYIFRSDDGKEEAVSPAKAKELNELIDEVRAGGKPADGRWYQTFRLAATEDGKLRIPLHDLDIAYRLHHLFEVVDGARKALLRFATDYANLVFAGAKGDKLRSRLELHEKARRSPIPERYKGSIYCVSDPAARNPSGVEELVCASSPLLAAGRIEQQVVTQTTRSRNWNRRGPDDQERVRQQIRGKVKFDWCYGGTGGKPLFGHTPTRAVSESGLSSPFLMEVPDSVQAIAAQQRPPPGPKAKPAGQPSPKAKPPSKAPGKPKAKRADLRTLQQLEREPREPQLTALEVGPGALAEALAAPTSPARKPPAAKPAAHKPPPPPPAHKSAPAVGHHYLMTARQQRSSTTNWLKCTGFQFSDEAWDRADPAREPKEKAGPKDQALPDGNPGGDARAGEQTAKIMKEVGGLIGSLLKFVLPKFADALERVQDLAHAAQEFYDKYVARFVDIAKKGWEQSVALLQKAKDLAAEVEKQVEEAAEKAKKAAIAAAGAAPGEAKKLADETKLKEEALLKELRSKATEARKGFDKVVKDASNRKAIDGTGELLGQILDELVGVITGRVAETLKPNARQLLAQGFKFVRSFLDPIAQSVISALAGIPFIGAGLAALGQVAYAAAMDYLETAAFDGLFGLVERIMAKLIRTVISPMMPVVAQAITKLAGGLCGAAMGAFPQACPKQLKFSELPERDRWLNRALACQGRPIFDKKMFLDAANAQLDMMNKAAKMRRSVQAYARDLADRYLARFGYTYDTWMAAVGQGDTSRLAARAGQIEHGLREATQLLGKSRRPR